MVLSGNSFEVFVKDEVKALTKAPSIFRSNYTFYDSSISTGRETDLILLKPYGTFILECKNYSAKHSSAYISGEEYEADWFFSSSGKRGTVVNPIMLNKRRIRCIQGLFRRFKFPVYNITGFVVVPDSCKVFSQCPNVLTLSNLIKYLNGLDERFSSSYTANEENSLQAGCALALDSIRYKMRNIKN